MPFTNTSFCVAARTPSLSWMRIFRDPTVSSGCTLRVWEVPFSMLMVMSMNRIHWFNPRRVNNMKLICKSYSFLQTGQALFGAEINQGQSLQLVHQLCGCELNRRVTFVMWLGRQLFLLWKFSTFVTEYRVIFRHDTPRHDNIPVDLHQRQGDEEDKVTRRDILGCPDGFPHCKHVIIHQLWKTNHIKGMGGELNQCLRVQVGAEFAGSSVKQLKAMASERRTQREKAGGSPCSSSGLSSMWGAESSEKDDASQRPFLLQGIMETLALGMSSISMAEGDSSDSVMTWASSTNVFVGRYQPVSLGIFCSFGHIGAFSSSSSSSPSLFLTLPLTWLSISPVRPSLSTPASLTGLCGSWGTAADLGIVSCAALSSVRDTS
ncbi:hypothetical protein FQN60_017717, partial [Etheostoma spectabile]